MFDDLYEILKPLKDVDKALKMKQYMRNQFDYIGLAAPVRRGVMKDFLKTRVTTQVIDEVFVKACWDCNYRELQYLCIDYLFYLSKSLESNHLELLKKLVVKKPWWDTIDSLAKLVGGIVAKDESLKEVMILWSLDENLWVRRIAILHQLQFKGKMDVNLLSRVILNNTAHPDFFIRKAIGWILRDYSKTDPLWVRCFVEQNKEKMNSLSIREASKYI